MRVGRFLHGESDEPRRAWPINSHAGAQGLASVVGLECPVVEAIIKLFGTQRLTVNVVFELINREPLITDYAFDKIAD